MAWQFRQNACWKRVWLLALATLRWREFPFHVEAFHTPFSTKITSAKPPIAEKRLERSQLEPCWQKFQQKRAFSLCLFRRKEHDYVETQKGNRSQDNSNLQGSLKKLPMMGACVALMVSLLFSGSLPLVSSSTARAISIDGDASFYNSKILHANEDLIDYAVGTINTQYYDNSGGAWFNPRDFYMQWKILQHAVEENAALEQLRQQPELQALYIDPNPPLKSQTLERTTPRYSHNNNAYPAMPKSLRNLNVPREALQLDTREGTVQALKWLVGSLQDPYSKYMTKEDLRKEYHGAHDGFLGTGAFVEAPHSPSLPSQRLRSKYEISSASTVSAKSGSETQKARNNNSKHHAPKYLSSTKVANLPVVTAVSPNSPAERAGLTVGDRIVAIGDRDFLGWTRPDIAKTLHSQYNAETYLGVADLTIAKPVYGAVQRQQSTMSFSTAASTTALRSTVQTNALASFDPSSQQTTSSSYSVQDVVLGYRATKLRLPTKATEPFILSWPQAVSSFSSSTSSGIGASTSQGDAVVQYELLGSSSGSIFDHSHLNGILPDDYKVGYIRLTRFSKLATNGFEQAVQALEDAGARSYIIDLRNNYGGVIQEAMLMASSLLRDPHAILCYLLNARGGFTPVDVEQYVVDARYPGYLMSKESKNAVLQQVQREHPSMFRGENGKVDWDPPSSYASIHEQVVTRGIHRSSYLQDEHGSMSESNTRQDHLFRKDLVLLINEGTASSAEFFTAALHDNGRSVAVVGTKSFGKGLIQHTFPMPDGGGLKLTVGEFLRPSLHHVTNVFDARFDSETGELTGGGVFPDVYCDSKQGIPGKPKADLCVGVALDVLEESALRHNELQ